MKQSEQLLERSIAATLSAIEVYNKPDFRYREEIFAILVINGWELLLKAKLLADAGEDIGAITAVDNKGVAKKSRTGANLTIGIDAAVTKLGLADKVRENIEFIIELRDAAIHFVNDADMKYMAYALGAATLQNYHRLCKDWFGRGLDEYNFYILPLGFAYNFKTLALLDVSSKPTEIASLLNALDLARQKHGDDPQGPFHLLCEVKTELVSVKKLVETTGATVAVGGDPSKATAIAIKYQAPIDKFPLSYVELWERVKTAKPNTKQSVFQKVLDQFNVRHDPKYSTYNFRSKAQKEAYDRSQKLPKGIPIIYNEDAVKFVVSKLP